MATKKQTKMGYDPLAWMQEDGDEPVAKKKPARKKATKKTTPKVAYVSPLGLDVELLETSFKALAPSANKLAKRFYEELFARYPAVKPMFANTTPAKQQKKLVAALALVVKSLRKPDALVEVLTNLGGTHQGYGAEPAHYEAVASTMLDVMEEFAGDLWTDEVHSAWQKALETIATAMLNGYKDSEEKTMANTQSAAVETNEALTRMQSAIDGAATAIMMIDRDFNITYANAATIKILKDNEAELRRVYPGFTADKVMGVNIDTFHKNPAHQRQLLSDPNNLPYKTDIQVGPLTFALNVTAQITEDGEYIGNSLEWSDVTEARKKELEVARLMSAVDGAEANLMLCDNDLNITYANPAVVEMLRNRQAELRTIWPGLDVDNLVGTCIDGFHKNPAHQRALLSDPNRLPATAEIEVGDLNFRVNATMITGTSGEYMGNMVQWTDITEQVDAEKQIQSLIDNATKGELGSRIAHENYAGFMKGLGEGINNLMDAVVEPLKGGMDVMQALSSGDLTRTMDGEYHGEFAVLKDSINGTVSNLIDVVGNIRESSGSIASASSEISQGNTNLSQRTEEQASSLEETASSMEELTGTVKQNADNARQANQLAAGARDQAEKGGAVVGNAINAMSEINSASKKIADIISVIDEIAFQTNLLALNAAVEAARAGEQGRGFAVVASEVRNLAQRSAGAAKEIKSLINDSVEKVDEGSRLVNESGDTLEEIVSAVKKVSDIIAEIAAASLEQSTGIEQVNQTVSQMDEVTQQNAALVEEAAAASESLDEQARGLDQLMTYFKLSNADTARSAAPRAPAAARPTPAASRPAARNPAPASNNDSEWEEF